MRAQYMKAFLSFGLFALISIAFTAQKNKPIRVLIVDGFSNHDWKQTTTVIKWILEKSGRFAVDVVTLPTDTTKREAWKPDFTKYGVVIQNTNNLNTPALRWSSFAEKALEKYVRKGGGLFILHSANNSFSQWPEYEKMIGMGWRPRTFGYALKIDSNKNIVRIPPGEGRSTAHGARFNAVIEILERHPINKGYPGQWKTASTEVYNYCRGVAENLTVLSYAFDSTATHERWPVEWIVKYGKGNVYNSSLGHLWAGDTFPPAYRCIGFQTTVIRVAEWLATGKVTYPVPANFPTKDAISLEDEDDFLKRAKQ